MHQDTLAREPLFFATGTLPSRRPERISLALVRNMAARMALETMQIERVAQEAMREFWEESAHPHKFPSLTAQAV